MPVNQTRVLTRQELYELVWTTPISKLAPTFGLSDVGFAKLCDRYDIPRPERGYWAKLEYGHKTAKVPLPLNNDPKLQTIQISPFDRGTPDVRIQEEPESGFDDDVKATLERARQLTKVIAASTLRNLHPLVLATQVALEDASPDTRNMIEPRGETLCIQISKAGIRRGLLYMNALIKAVESIGGKVEVVKRQWDQRTVVSFCGEESAVIRLRERYKQVPRKKNPEDRWWYAKYDYVPTGLFLLDHGPSYTQSAHSKDTEKGKRIEDDINRVIIEWVEETGCIRIRKKRAEEERLRKEAEERDRRESELELQRRREDLKRRQQVEQSRIENLCTRSSAWRHSKDLREYINEVERVAVAEHGRIEAGSELAQWLNWARQQADRIDPFVSSPASVLDEKI